MEKVIPDLKVFLILIFLSLFIFFLDIVKILNLPKQLVFYITNPVSFGIYDTNRNVGKQFHFIFQARFASQEKHLDPSSYNLLPARPVGLGRYLKIDKGTISGIKIGQAVVFVENCVGKIIAVTPASSNIQLLTDPDSKIAAFSQNKDGKGKGVLIGQFGTDILMDKILHEEKIAEGDLVYSEGLEGFLPRGLVLGKVSQVIEQTNEVF